MSTAKRIMSQWEVDVGTPPDYEECRGAWSELVCLSKRNKSIVKGMEKRQTAEHQRGALVVSSRPSFVSAGRMGGTGGIISFEVVIERLKGRLDAVVGGFCNVVTGLGYLKAATQRVISSGQAVWAELVRLLGIVQGRSEDLLAAAKKATGAIMRLVSSVEVARENV